MNQLALSYCNKLPHLANDSWRDFVGSDFSDDSHREIDKTVEELNRKCVDTRKLRSMSDGCTNIVTKRELFEVFPSLPDAVLEKLGLDGSADKTALNDEELEQKFISLSLAFTIDAATISNRCLRQRRSRDQTETNLNAEIMRLVQQVHQLRPLCVNAETTEMLTTLLDQVERIERAADHAMISAERHGAIQHEKRLATAVQLMIQHVHALKAQRDSSRRQLQYTRRVLQETHVGEDVHVQKQLDSCVNGHQACTATKRRASIATICRSKHHEAMSNVDLRKITRRTSEFVLRGGVLVRSLKPTRMDFGLDLTNLRRNSGDRNVVAEENEECDDVNANSSTSELQKLQNSDGSSFLQTMFQIMRKLVRLCEHQIEELNTNFFYFCALVCFSLSIISLGNILVELQNERNDKWFQHWFYNAH